MRVIINIIGGIALAIFVASCGVPQQATPPAAEAHPVNLTQVMPAVDHGPLGPFFKHKYHVPTGGRQITLGQFEEGPGVYFVSLESFKLFKLGVNLRTGRTLSYLIAHHGLRTKPCMVEYPSGHFPSMGLDKEGRGGWGSRACAPGELILEGQRADNKWVAVASLGCGNLVPGSVFVEKPPVTPIVVSDCGNNCGPKPPVNPPCTGASCVPTPPPTCIGSNCPVPPPPPSCVGSSCPTPPPPTCTGSNCNPPPNCTGSGCNPPPTCTGSNCNPPPSCTGSNCPVPPPPHHGGCNNGWGNNSQCAPGNSLNRNNAENREGDRENGTNNPNGMTQAPGASGTDKGGSASAPGQQGGHASSDTTTSSPNHPNGAGNGNSKKK